MTILKLANPIIWIAFLIFILIQEKFILRNNFNVFGNHYIVKRFIIIISIIMNMSNMVPMGNKIYRNIRSPREACSKFKTTLN